MQLIRYPSSCKTSVQAWLHERGVSAALGNFDGVHRGHQQVIAQAVSHAQEQGLVPAVITFDPHPKQYFSTHPTPFQLQSLRQKLAMFARLGVEFSVVLPFRERLAQVTAEAFIDKILVQQLAVKHVAVGHDFSFGFRRQGNVELLRNHAAQLSVYAQEAVLHDGIRCASSTIRGWLAEGNIAAAAAMLGHDVSIAGRVVHGGKLAAGLGFPTANIRLAQYNRPRFGVYAVSALLPGDAEFSLGMANIGVKPTLGGVEEPVLEAHFFDRNIALYGHQLEIKLHHFIRDEQRFSSIENLRQQIVQDMKTAQQWAAQHWVSSQVPV